MIPQNVRVLIIDDDRGIRESYNQILSADPENSIVSKGRDLFPEKENNAGATPYRHYDLTQAENGEEGVEAVRKAFNRRNPFAVAFVDMMMPGINGAEAAKEIWRIDPDIKLVIVTAYSDYTPDDIVRLVGREDLYYLRKPFNPEEIRQFARVLTHQWELEMERQRLSTELNMANQQLTKYTEDLQVTVAELKNANEKLALLRDYEIDTASKIQQTLLLGHAPQHFQGIRLHQKTIPSQKVDGDFIDFIRHSDGVLDIIVGDVMGKGVPAALMGAALKTRLLRAVNELIRADDQAKIPEPEIIVAEVQAGMIEQLEDLETFVTLIYARFDLSRNEIRFVDCGHTRMIHYQKETKTCRLLEGVNMPLGFPEKEPFTRISVPFRPGDLFLFYSDGLTEAKNASAELYGEKRLMDFVQQHAGTDVRELIENIWQDVVSFSQSEIFGDDFTCIGVGITDPGDTGMVHPMQEVLDIKSDLDTLERVREFVGNVCTRTAAELLSHSRVDLIKLAINEAVVNIIKHAYRNASDKPVRIEAQSLPQKIVFRLYDEGLSFDPASIPPPAFDGSKDHGFGIYIIDQAVDELVYSQEADGRNCVTMTINLRGGS